MRFHKQKFIFFSLVFFVLFHIFFSFFNFYQEKKKHYYFSTSHSFPPPTCSKMNLKIFVMPVYFALSTTFQAITVYSDSSRFANLIRKTKTESSLVKPKSQRESKKEKHHSWVWNCLDSPENHQHICPGVGGASHFHWLRMLPGSLLGTFAPRIEAESLFHILEHRSTLHEQNRPLRSFPKCQNILGEPLRAVTPRHYNGLWKPAK